MINLKIKFYLLIPVLLILLFVKYVHATNIYVNIESASVDEDGSEANPYHSIAATLEKASTEPENNRQIMIRSGDYKEELVLPDGAILVGESKDNVIIDRDNMEGAAITTGRNSIIENVTVRGGNYAVVIPANKRTTIRNCLIERSKRIGVWIKRGNNLTENEVDIKENGHRNK